MLAGFRRQAPGVRKEPITRDIQVECVIRPDGKVHSARVVGEHDEDMRGWIADMMSREFRPGKVNGEPVWCRMTVTIREDSIPAGPSDPVGVSL